MNRLVLVILCFVLVLSGCTINISGLKNIEGSGNVVEVKPEVESFNKLGVHNAFDVVVSDGDEATVIIDIDDNLVDYLDVYVRGDKLHIGMEPGITGFSKATFKAYVTLPEIEGVEGTGATSTILEDGLKYGEFMRVDISGASKIRGDIETDKLEVELSGASEYRGEVKAEDIDMSLSGSSDVSVSGQATNASFRASGSSSVNGFDLETDDARIDISGASDLKLIVNDTIRVEASGASDVLIDGHPSIEKQDISGGADVEYE